MICAKCGNNMSDNALFCPACGMTVAEAPQPAAPMPQQAQAPQPAPPMPQQSAMPMQQQAGAQQPMAPMQQQASLQKSKMAAGLLGIFLGWLGVHNFYLGYTGKAVAQLLISLLSCLTLSLISWIWGLIEGILILTGSINVDANGNPLKD